MALTFGFYDSVNGDRTYNAKDFSRFFDGILTDGIFGDIGDALRVTAGSGLSVNVGIGRAWFNRTWTWNDSVLNIPLPTADPVLPRIDTVALIIDDILRTNSIEIIQGTASSSPAAPTLTNTSDHHEYRLADVAIAATATSITNNNITDFVGTAQTPYTNVMPSILFFQNNITPKMDGTASIGTAKTYSRADHVHPTDTSRATLASPAFTGTPTAPTATSGTNTTQIATTAFVKTAIDNSKSSMALSGTPTAPTAAAGTNTTQIATTAFVKTAIDNAIASKANLASPTFTGTPKAPTAAAGTNTTQIATTAFVQTAINNAHSLRVYRQTTGYNGDYPLIASRTAAGSIGTSGSNNSYSDVYGVMWNDTTKVPTINPSTGKMKVPGGITADLDGKVNGVFETDMLGLHLYSSSAYPATYDVKIGAGGIYYYTAGTNAYKGAAPLARFLEGNIHLTDYTSRIPATVDGSIAERDHVSMDDNRPLTGGSLARVFGQIGARDIGTNANFVSWRLIGYTPVTAYNDVDPNIPGMIRFYYG